MKNPVLFVLFVVGLVGNCHAGDDWSKHPEWLGAWKVTPEVTRLLGFKDQEENSAILNSLQIEFFVSKDAALDGLGKEAVGLVEARVNRMGHTIVAAGRFREPKDDDTGWMCFVTQNAGATFLWLGDQAESTSFAKIHYLRGVTPEHDLLILDWGGVFENRMQGQKYIDSFKAFGYRRLKE